MTNDDQAGQILLAGEIILVSGPARSGKSEWAEQLAARHNCPVIYLATSVADPTDIEWQARLDLHRQRRPAQWQLWEVPTDLAEAIAQAPGGHCLLIDSLGTWLANLLALDPQDWQRQVEALLNSLRRSPNPVILVAEETGWGVVPAYPLGRLFRDRLGALCRQIGAIAAQVYLVNHGFALDLRQLGVAIDAVSDHPKTDHPKTDHPKTNHPGPNPD
jgi:adenosylcobinamide kinase / adenosylcobinamide-phosphate guanylyltransferase